ncbi:MAG: hypothetical protein P4L87_00820 [Formivibrio sp.]|nr:hypothetical protein [Formivibrio sp.]
MTTPFEALCAQSEAVRPNLSDIGKRVFAPLLRVFTGDILPQNKQDKPTFTDDDCKLYVRRREWRAQFRIDDAPDENRYELLMEACFWGVGPFADQIEKRKLIFVSGTIGSGKSTFIDYYLRCYCPCRSPRAVSFSEKLIIRFDLKNRQTEVSIDDKMWSDLSFCLKSAGIDPNTLFDFDNERQPSQRLIRQVLKRLCTQMQNGAFFKKKYLIIVMDNIDQSTKDGQIHCLNLVRDVMHPDSGINCWRIIFPLWPQTLSRLRRAASLSIHETDFHEIELGHLDISEFYRKKIDYLTMEYGENSDPRAVRVLNEVKYLADAAYKDTLRALTYGNFVVMDSLIVDMLQSNELAEHEQRSVSTHISDYRFYDSLINGVHQHHCIDKSDLLNPFGWHRNISSEHHIFIVPYLIDHMAEAPEHRTDDIFAYFQRHCFRHALIEEAINVMEEFNMLHFEGNRATINPHRSVLRAYRQFMLQPAALDNFAITTPVRKATLDRRWTITKGYMPSQFYERCQTTLLFLRELLELEIRIDNHVQEAGHSLDDFRRQVPRVAGRASISYRQRLNNARDYKWPANANMTEERWRTLDNENNLS